MKTKIVGKSGYEYVATFEEVWNSGAVAAIKVFQREFQKWTDNQYGAGVLVMTFDEMLDQARKEVLKQESD